MPLQPEARELAFYYPNPFPRNGGWIKNLILFFDGVALLVPNYMKDRIAQFDPAIVSGLEQHSLLHIIEPEVAVDQAASESLASALTEIITSGALDKLADTRGAFHEISMSRLGYYGDSGLAEMIVDELKNRGLAKDTEDGVSIPLHPMVRTLVLTLLSQILRKHGNTINAELCPATDVGELVTALSELLNVPSSPTAGHVVAFDIATVGVDLGSVPIEDVLEFRKDSKELCAKYRRTVHRFARELSLLSPEQRELAFDERQEDLDGIASGIRRQARNAWRKPCSFALTMTGAYLKANPDHSLLGGLVAALGLAVGSGSSSSPEMGAYSYLFRSKGRFSP